MIEYPAPSLSVDRHSEKGRAWSGAGKLKAVVLLGTLKAGEGPSKPVSRTCIKETPHDLKVYAICKKNLK